MQRFTISASVARLSIYHRILISLETNNIEFISSLILGAKAGFKDAQVRKDLAFFGSFGQPGKGYKVKKLRDEIGRILGKEKRWKIGLVGVGNLGSALLSYAGFKVQGFDVVAAFDIDPKKIGRRFGAIIVEDIKNISKSIAKKKIEIGIIAVSEESAQKVTDLLVKSEIKAILNFAPTLLNIPNIVKLHNVDLSVELDKLSHMLSSR